MSCFGGGEFAEAYNQRRILCCAKYLKVANRIKQSEKSSTKCSDPCKPTKVVLSISMNSARGSTFEAVRYVVAMQRDLDFGESSGVQLLQLGQRQIDQSKFIRITSMSTKVASQTVRLLVKMILEDMHEETEKIIRILHTHKPYSQPKKRIQM